MNDEIVKMRKSLSEKGILLELEAKQNAKNK